MATKRVISDKDFGRIIIRTNLRARNITMRPKEDGLYVTVPPYAKTTQVLEAIVPFREKLLVNFKLRQPEPLGFGFSICTECFKLYLEKTSLRYYTAHVLDGVAYVGCPKDTDFSNPAVDRFVRAAIVRAMKRKAEMFLPPLLDYWSQHCGLPYRKVKITMARSRWGSCSSTKAISLSCYLMLLPSRLMDYVILHELAHTVHMNHGPEFWELLDRLTGDQALQLRKELRNYHTAF